MNLFASIVEAARRRDPLPEIFDTLDWVTKYAAELNVGPRKRKRPQYRVSPFDQHSAAIGRRLEAQLQLSKARYVNWRYSGEVEKRLCASSR